MTALNLRKHHSGADLRRQKQALGFASKAFLSAFLLCVLLQLFYPIRLIINTSHRVVDRDGKLIAAYLNASQKWRMAIADSDITPVLSNAIRLKEDRWFWYHPGVNPFAIGRALMQNYSAGKRASGASTITMQLARMLHPQARTWWAKLKEVGMAMRLESTFSKQEILNAYLTLVPYGGNIEGLQAAALLYYGKKPSELSLAQMATLIVVPNRPTSLRLSKSGNELLLARNHWIKRLAQNLGYSVADMTQALTEPLALQRQALPHVAPQLSSKLLKQHIGQTLIETTLDGEIQQKAQTIVAEYVNRIKLQGISNGAALVINNATHEVLAYVGSADVADRASFGQVDGVQALRSPGSTLKPLVYSIAMDKGLCTPQSVLYDVPLAFDGYRPENYDKTYNGAVTVETALSNSLNVPAVNMLNLLGIKPFTSNLGRMGFEWIGKNQNRLGLSTILGGCGATLQELAGMYCTLANGGVYAPLVVEKGGQKKKGTRIVSTEAAYLVTDILSKLNRPDLPNNLENSMHAPKIAWKTGTSYGRRDAWAIGYNPTYTVAVWCGNFDGHGVPELSGADVATPLLFRLFEALPALKGKWFSVPNRLDERLVCTATGDVAGPDCNETTIDYCIRGVSRAQTCRHQVAIPVNIDGTLSYCQACLPENAIRKFYPNYPPEYSDWLQTKGMPGELPPPHNPECTRVFAGNKPVIVSLSEGKEYLFSKKDGPCELQLACQTTGDVHKVFWFIDNRFVGEKVPNDQSRFPVAEGAHVVAVSDDKGRTSRIQIQVSAY